MSQVRSFDPTRATLELGGKTCTGYADSKINVTPNNSRSTVTEGIDGDISVNIDSRFAGTLSVNLMQNSTMARTLDAWILSVKTTGNPFFPVTLRDESSRVGLGTVGWIQDQADYEVAQETGTRTYVIGIADSRLKPLTDLEPIQSLEAFSGALGLF